ncbi:hypothetical protein VTK26DRAFT_4635 [Humicola hyalothermophila]
MGKPSIPPTPGPAGSSSDADALSLHTHTGARAFDNDAPELSSDDMPPLYSEIEADNSNNAPLLPAVQDPSTRFIAFGGGMHTVDQSTANEYFIDAALDENPDFLKRQVELSAKKPPQPAVRILGTHTQVVHEHGKRKRRTVTDFDVTLELTPYLYSDAVRDASWRELRTVEDSEKTRRGTVFRQRAPGVKRDIEIRAAGKPTLTEWCHRYCAKRSGLKCFALRRKVTGFDQAKMKQNLLALVRGTNYRGSVQITFPVKGQYVYIYNDCKVNRWRMTTWVVWLCYLTFLWLFTWPYLFLRTKMFEVAVVEWPFSITNADGSKRYVSMSEDHLYNLWGRAISRAILDRRQCTLDQEDLLASQTAPEQPFANALGDAPRLLRAGITAITAVNRHIGWGADELY